MSNPLTRRALAAGAAALAAAGLGTRPGSAGRRCRARRQPATHIGMEGEIRIDGTSLFVERITHVGRFHHDAAGWERVHDHHRHATLVPAPGSTLVYAIHGMATPGRPEGDDGDAPGNPEAFHATFAANAGSYDPATGSLALEGEGRVEWPDSPGIERQAVRYAEPWAAGYLPPAA